MGKRWAAHVAAIVGFVVFGMIALTTSKVPTQWEGDFGWGRLTDGRTVAITGFRGTDTDIEFPSRISGMPVTQLGGSSIGDGFSDMRLTGVIIPDGVVWIWGWAFARNRLVGITIPDSVAIIGEGAFAENQLANIIIGDYVEIGRTPDWFDGNDPFGSAFAEFYESHGRRAGTYTYNDGEWSFQPR